MRTAKSGKPRDEARTPWMRSTLLGCSVQLVEDERWAADLAACEASDGAVHADGGGVIVEVDCAVDALQVAGFGAAVDAHVITDVQPGERLGGVDPPVFRSAFDRISDLNRIWKRACIRNRDG